MWPRGRVSCSLLVAPLFLNNFDGYGSLQIKFGKRKSLLHPVDSKKRKCKRADFALVLAARRAPGFTPEQVTPISNKSQEQCRASIATTA